MNCAGAELGPRRRRVMAELGPAPALGGPRAAERDRRAAGVAGDDLTPETKRSQLHPAYHCREDEVRFDSQEGQRFHVRGLLEGGRPLWPASYTLVRRRGHQTAWSQLIPQDLAIRLCREGVPQEGEPTPLQDPTDGEEHRLPPHTAGTGRCPSLSSPYQRSTGI